MPSDHLQAGKSNEVRKIGGNKVYILGIGVAVTSMTQVLNKIDQVVHSSLKKSFIVVTVNQEFIMLAQADPLFNKILNNADLTIPDGVGLRLAGVNTIVPGRKLVSALITKSYRIYYLGGRGNVAKEMADKFGGLAGAGHTNIRSQMLDARENQRIINKINLYKPDILLVAYGAPWQEKWLWTNRDKIKAKVAMGVGGTFDYLTDRAKMPPDWINQLGLEWLWRLVHEPWRWRRQLNLLRFVWQVWLG